jgi:fatty acid desaturase
MSQAPRGISYALPKQEYALLRRQVDLAISNTPPLKQFFTIASITSAALTLCHFMITRDLHPLWHIINATAMGFFTVQLGLLGHDLSHQSVFQSQRKNQILATLIWGLGCGLSERRWFAKHNMHHAAPNHIGHDPDIEIPFIFDHEQTESLSPFQRRWLLPYQHYLFWIGIWFVYPYNLLNSLRFIGKQINWITLIEIILMFAHFGLLFWLTFTYLPFSTAVLFLTITCVAASVYMGLIFAPNHKGEDMLPAQATYNWVHQITLSRNITASPLIDYIFGGLQYQIEHHLFPTYSRFHYPTISRIVRSFCQENNIPYHETTWLASLAIIHTSLKQEAMQGQLQ